jgi:hypothetical protein
LYDSASDETLEWEIALMKRAMLDFVIVSWYGPGSYEDAVLRTIFKLADSQESNSSSTLKWCVLYEREGQTDPDLAEIVRDLVYIGEAFGKSESYFRIDERLVIFVMADGNDSVSYAEKWREASNRVGGFYTVLKVFPNFIEVAGYADSWFQYTTGERFEFQGSFSAFASPGYWRYDEQRPRLERDVPEFAMALTRLYYEPVIFLLIESWNNWLEGSQVEPAFKVDRMGNVYAQSSASYGMVYIDMIRRILRGEDRLVVQPSDLRVLLGIASNLFAGILIVASTVDTIRRKVEVRSRLFKAT